MEIEIHTKRIIKFLLLPLLIAVCLIFYYNQKIEQNWQLHVDFLDVGQGDSELITTFTGNQVLIDGGPGDKVLTELSKIMGPFDHTIDMIVLTHAHLDHFEGLIKVLERYEVKKVVFSNTDIHNSAFDIFLQAVNDEHAEIIYAQQGQRFYLDNSTVLDILYPLSKNQEHIDKNDDVNDTSVIAKLTFGKIKMLFTGDAGTNIEDELLPEFNLDVDLLKVGHHGSKHSSSDEFLKETSPEYAVIEVGENNSYGHPTKEILDKLTNFHVQVFRTDLDHEVSFTSDGFTLRRSDKSGSVFMESFTNLLKSGNLRRQNQ